MRFRVCVIIGDRKGRVGYGVAKGADVAISVNKAVAQAKKRLFRVPLVGGTIPHAVTRKYSAARVLLKPAPKGTGVKAGGAVRVVLELAGVPNAVAKILGSDSKLNNAKATIEALKSMKRVAGESKSRKHPERPKDESGEPKKKTGAGDGKK